MLGELICFSPFLAKPLLHAYSKGTHQRPSLSPLKHPSERDMKVLLMSTHKH